LWEFGGSNRPITSSGRWWDSVSHQFEQCFTDLQGFSEGVIFVYPVSPNENISFLHQPILQKHFWQEKEVNGNLQPAHNEYIKYKHHNQPSVDFTRDVIFSLLANLKCLDENG
jgi:hypothetical protein